MACARSCQGAGPAIPTHRYLQASSTAQDDLPAPDAVRVSLYARDAETWTLRRPDDTYVCTLPCAYWVRPESRLTIRLEGSTPTMLHGVPEDGTTFELPPNLPANPGESVTVTVDRTHGLGTLGKIIAGPLAVTFGIMGIAFTALSTASLATGSKSTTSTASGCVSSGGGAAPAASGCVVRTDHGVASDIGGLAIGLGALTVAVLSTWWFFHDREGGLAYERSAVPRSALRARLVAGGLRLDSAEIGIWLSPAGVAGTF